MESRFYIYRLFDPERPEITRYVGCTDNPTRRQKQHASPCTMTTSLVRPWAAWLAGLGLKPKLEVISELSCDIVEAKAQESNAILNASNQWLLNAKAWRDDKVASGINRHVVNAYHAMVSHGSFRDGYVSAGSTSEAAFCLEKAYPRLRIFHCRYFPSHSKVA